MLSTLCHFHGLLFAQQMLDKPICRHPVKCAVRYSSIVNEWLGDLSPTEAGIRVGEQLIGVECPVWPFLVNLPA
jgi:hypothetical protein